MYEYLREKLIDELANRGIHDVVVLKAFSLVQREKFIPEALAHRAYENSALPIAKGQTISQPYTIAVMMQELKLKKGFRILEVGTGSGYQAALLKSLGLDVYTVERDYDLYVASRKLFEDMNFRIGCRFGDGTIGWSEFAPYDGIIVTAGSPTAPTSLLKQLAIGGRLVIPIGNMHSQNINVYLRVEEDKYETEVIPAFRFVPLIGQEGWQDLEKNK